VAAGPAVATFLATLVFRDVDDLLALVDPALAHVREFTGSEAEAATDLEHELALEREPGIERDRAAQEQLELARTEAVVNAVVRRRS
jgi:hypothetical protein